MTLDDVFNGNCEISWINYRISRTINKFVPGNYHIYMSEALKHSVIRPGIVKIEIRNWEPVAQFLQQEKLIKIEDGKVTLLF